MTYQWFPYTNGFHTQMVSIHHLFPYTNGCYTHEHACNPTLLDTLYTPTHPPRHPLHPLTHSRWVANLTWEGKPHNEPHPQSWTVDGKEAGVVIDYGMMQFLRMFQAVCGWTFLQGLLFCFCGIVTPYFMHITS